MRVHWWKRGYKPGNLIIDEGWQQDYGMWSFDTGKFPNAKAMVDELHNMGFKVMLWVVPYISPDCNAYRELIADKAAKHCMRCKGRFNSNYELVERIQCDAGFLQPGRL